MAIIKPFRAIRPANEFVKEVAELPYDEKVYFKAKENLQNLIDKKVLIKEDEEAIYIYREIANNKSQIGIVACVSVDDNLNGVIKKHEYTKPDKELDRTNHIKYCNANTGTVLLTYRNKEEIDKIVDYYVYFMHPLYDFKTEDNVIHTIWKVEKERDINDLIKEFKQVKNLYIADGHHRCDVAQNIALEKRKENQNYTGEEEFNYFTAMIAPNNHFKYDGL